MLTHSAAIFGAVSPRRSVTKLRSDGNVACGESRSTTERYPWLDEWRDVIAHRGWALCWLHDVCSAAASAHGEKTQDANSCSCVKLPGRSIRLMLKASGGCTHPGSSVAKAQLSSVENTRHLTSHAAARLTIDWSASGQSPTGPKCKRLLFSAGACEKTILLRNSFPAVNRQKLLSGSRFGALQADIPMRIIFWRSCFSQTPVSS